MIQKEILCFLYVNSIVVYITGTFCDNGVVVIDICYYPTLLFPQFTGNLEAICGCNQITSS